MEKKIIELKNSGYSDREIIENIFLNYPSKYQNDLIYKIKKQISIFFNVPINNIKLIGSAHWGLKKKDEDLCSVDDPSDLDFAIIDSNCYINQLSEINEKKMIAYGKKESFNTNLYYGKIHYMFLKKNNDIFTFFNKLKDELKMDKNISICIYVSEEFFLKGLECFFNLVITNYYKKYKDIKKVNFSMELKEVTNFK